MNISPIVRSTLVIAAALSAVGCNQDKFLGNNISPNNPSSVSPGVLLANIEAHTAFTVSNNIGRVTELFVQHYAGIANQPATQDAYGINGEFNNEWQFDIYAGTLADTQKLIEQTQATSPLYAGISKILQAYNFAYTTDLWGDIPYSEALKGDANLLQPRFDKQEDIYKGNASLNIVSLFDLVKDGLADLDKTSVLTPGGQDDLIFSGSAAKWKQVGNTLLLKMANTISRRDPALATTIINEVLQRNTYIKTNADDLEFKFGTTVGNTNPFYAYNVTNRPNDQMASRRFIDSLALRNDPRLPRFFTTTPANGAAVTTPLGIFTGFENTANVAAPLAANRSKYNTYIVGTSGEAPVRMITNFQRAFILAESALILKTAGDPQVLFEEGIRASMTKAGVSATDITAYLAAPANKKWVVLSGSNEQKRNQIITQKWIAFIGMGIEAYNDYRRTGYPRLAQVPNTSGDVVDGKIPVRFLYPTSEATSNTKNIPTPLPQLNQRVWWDID